MKEKFYDGTLTLFLRGRLTSENAEETLRDIEAACALHPDSTLIFDAERLEYISSAGLRILLKVEKASKKRITVQNVSQELYNIFEITGFTSMMNVQKKLRNILIDGCPVIGEGRSSTVYRLNRETIVKCYKPNVPMSMIANEMELAKKAFVADIPTAISYDLVRVGSSYGVVFELIDAETVGAFITSHMEQFDEVTRKFVEVYKKIHCTRLEEGGVFPSVKEMWLGWVEGMSTYYRPEESAFLREMIVAVPDRDTMVHCDYHENNVLYKDGELILIDMANVGYGHPIFDLAGGAFRAHCDAAPDRGANTHGLSPENMQRFWDTILHDYFEPKDEAEYGDVRDMCEAFGFLRSALFPMKHVQISEFLRNWHIADARKNLFLRQDWARTQIRKLDRYFHATRKELATSVVSS